MEWTRVSGHSLNSELAGTLLLAAWAVASGPSALLAQPVITNQPASQAATAGATVLFGVGASGPGPVGYQWQLNGTNLPNNLMIRVVGNGSAGSSGDGGPATNAGIYDPYSLAIDEAGQIFATDTYRARIRKVDTHGIIHTVAGTGVNGYSGDGGPATAATIDYPFGLALDSTGNLYIADTENGRVRRVDTGGMITTVAGNGANGYTGDGGPATNATMQGPIAVILDAAGNLYVTDENNNCVRRVDTNGIITTVAGTGPAGYSGDGGMATNASLNNPSGLATDRAGNLYIADSWNNRVRKIGTDGIIRTVAGNGGSGYTGDGWAATNASLGSPMAVALDASGTLYIADYDNNVVRAVATNGIITTVAGGGLQRFGSPPLNFGPATNAFLRSPVSLALDPSGNLYIGSFGLNLVAEVVGSGLPTLTLSNITIANQGNYTVIVTNLAGAVTSSVASLTVQAAPKITTQPASQFGLVQSNVTFQVVANGSAPLSFNWFFNRTNLLLAGTNSALTLSNLTGADAGQYSVTITNAYGGVTSALANLGVGYAPSVVSASSNQIVWPGSNLVLSVVAGGTGPFDYQWWQNGRAVPVSLIQTVAGYGPGGTGGNGSPATNVTLNGAICPVVDPVGNFYFAESLASCICKVDASGVLTTIAGNGTSAYAGDGGPATNASLNGPEGLAFDSLGDLLIGDLYNQRIRMITPAGFITTIAGTGPAGYSGDGAAATNAQLYYPEGLALDTSNNLYIADEGNHRIRRVDTNGTITTVAGKGAAGWAGDGGPATNALLKWPQSVCLDALGNLYLADTGNNRIRKVDTNGVITTIAGTGAAGYAGDGAAATNGAFNNPIGLVSDPYGNLYIGDASNNRIRKVNTSGVVTSVAGNGYAGFTGDGGPADLASLNFPSTLGMDAAGNLYVGDARNYRIRKVTYRDYPAFALTPVTSASGGAYTVTITTPYGSATCTVATLTVAVPPAFSNIALAPDGSLTLDCVGTPSCSHTLWMTTNLAPAATWWPLSTNLAGAQGDWQVTDTNNASSPMRFYRLSMP